VSLLDADTPPVPGQATSARPTPNWLSTRSTSTQKILGLLLPYALFCGVLEVELSRLAVKAINPASPRIIQGVFLFAAILVSGVAGDALMNKATRKKSPERGN
jgi:hypothetical protein